jgi:type I restriction enzyme, S subunit
MTEFPARPLSELATFLSGGTPSKWNSAYWGGQIPWLTPKDMNNFTGKTEEAVTAEAIGNGTRIAPADALFIAVRGMSLHTEIRIVRVKEEMAFNQDIKAIVPGDIDPEFLYFALLNQKPYLLSVVESAGHGTGRLPTDQLESLDIPHPAMPEQKAIAATLSVLDDKIEQSRLMNETLEAMAQLLFRDWFVDFGPIRTKIAERPAYLNESVWSLFPNTLDSDDLPTGWVRKPIDEIAEFLNGLALQKFPPGDADDLPVIKIAQLRQGVTSRSDRTSGKIPLPYIVEDGDILFSWSGSLTHLVWTGGRGALNQHLFKVTSEKYPKWFVFYWINQHMPNFQSIAASKATTMGHIQRHHLNEAFTVVPDNRVLAAADEIIGPIFERHVTNKLENRRLVELRDFLLPKLMSGEIRLKDADKQIEEAL